MSDRDKDRRWALLQSVAFIDGLDRLSSKHRGQVSRKTMDLARNPRPGGSRTRLVGFDGLCRVRAGDYRLIYAYSEESVLMLTLRRRSEDTYDQLDELELQELDSYRSDRPSKSAVERIADWEERAKEWAAPKHRMADKLPGKITETLLEKLQVPEEHWPVLLGVTTVDGLLDCEEVPIECREKIVEHFCPTAALETAGHVLPVVTVHDLVDSRAAAITGPLTADQVASDTDREATDMARKEKGKTTDRSTNLPVPFKVPAPLVIVSTRRLEPMKPYRGNTQRGIAKDTKYSVRLDGSVQLVYYVGAAERALLTTDEHPELVELVNEAKRIGGASSGGGAFVINEYRHVLVPTQDRRVLYAGVYTPDLEFTFERSLISPVAPSHIRPGMEWPGPHVGVRYTLAAGATDIRYEELTERETRKDVKLSDFHSGGEIAGLLRMFRAVKPNGGAIYVNEARELFAPVDTGTGYKRIYIGHLGDHPWFPEPI